MPDDDTSSVLMETYFLIRVSHSAYQDGHG